MQSFLTQTNDHFDMYLHYVFEISLDLYESRELFSTHKWLRTLMTSENYLMVLGDLLIPELVQDSYIYKYNLSSGELSESIWEFERLQMGDANFSSDGSTIYGISNYNGIRSITAFDMNAKIFSPIYIPEDGFINNVTVFRTFP